MKSKLNFGLLVLNMFKIIRALHSVTPLQRFQIVSEIGANGEKSHVIHLHFGEIVPFVDIGPAVSAAGFRVLGDGNSYSIFRGKIDKLRQSYRLKRGDDGKSFALTKVRVARGKPERKGVPLGLLERPLLERRVANLIRPKL